MSQDAFEMFAFINWVAFELSTIFSSPILFDLFPVQSQQMKFSSWILSLSIIRVFVFNTSIGNYISSPRCFLLILHTTIYKWSLRRVKFWFFFSQSFISLLQTFNLKSYFHHRCFLLLPSRRSIFFIVLWSFCKHGTTVLVLCANIDPWTLFGQGKIIFFKKFQFCFASTQSVGHIL